MIEEWNVVNNETQAFISALFPSSSENDTWHKLWCLHAFVLS